MEGNKLLGYSKTNFLFLLGLGGVLPFSTGQISHGPNTLSQNTSFAGSYASVHQVYHNKVKEGAA